MPVPNIAQSRVAGVIGELKETWRQNMPTWEKQAELLIWNLKPTNIRVATYPWKESVPFPSLWPYGAKRLKKLFKDVALVLSLVNYELSVPWSIFDEEDDQLGDLRLHN